MNVLWSVRQKLLHYLSQQLLVVITTMGVLWGGTTIAQAAQSIELSFDLMPVSQLPANPSSAQSVDRLVPSGTDPELPRAQRQVVASTTSSDRIPDPWWQQGSDSPLAVAIGAAEGTRTPSGDRTPAYYWHRDPGNGANNFGTFSYQHLSPRDTKGVDQQPTTAQKRQVAATQGLPEVADERQLRKLENIHEELQAQATARGLALTQLEVVNGLDLANQSEAAALAKEGYIDRLAQMKQVTSNPDEQITEARTWSYWHPDRQRWDAPGLGNTYASIRQDQVRRTEAVKSALATVAPQSPAQPVSGTQQREAIANQIIYYNAP